MYVKEDDAAPGIPLLFYMYFPFTPIPHPPGGLTNLTSPGLADSSGGFN
jgi:hypothetical protein